MLMFPNMKFVRKNISYAPEIDTLAMDEISALSSSCGSCFDRLIESLKTSSDDFRKQMMPQAMDTQLGRFLNWADYLNGELSDTPSAQAFNATLRKWGPLQGAVLAFLRFLLRSLNNSTLRCTSCHV